MRRVVIWTLALLAAIAAFLSLHEHLPNHARGK